MLKKNKAPNAKKVFREVKKNIRAVKENLNALKAENSVMLSNIDKINKIWNDGRSEELKAADEIQPDKLITLLQEYVHRQGTGEYEEARQRYIYESNRWVQAHAETESKRDGADALRDSIRGTKRSVVLQDGSTLECWVDCQNNDENFDKHYGVMLDAHVAFGKSLAVLDKRMAAAQVYWGAILKEFPREIPADTGLVN